MEDTPHRFSPFSPALSLFTALFLLSAAFSVLPADAAPTFSSKSTAVISVPAAPSSLPGAPSGEVLSFAEVLMEAENGDPEMEFLAGLGFDRGDRGAAEDPLQAAYWYERSAAGGNPMARAMLAYHYHTGYGRRTDKRKALILWRDALPGLVLEYRNGNVYASLILDLFYYRDRDRWHPRGPVYRHPLPPGRYYYDSIRRIPFPPRRYWPDGRRMPPRHRWDSPGHPGHTPVHYGPPKGGPGHPPQYGPPPKGPGGPGKDKPKAPPPNTGLRRNTERKNSAGLLRARKEESPGYAPGALLFGI